MLVIIEGVGSHLCVALCVTGSNPLCLSVCKWQWWFNHSEVQYNSVCMICKPSSLNDWHVVVVIERLSWVLLCLTCQKMDQDWDWDHPCVRVLVVRIYKTNTQTPFKRLTKIQDCPCIIRSPSHRNFGLHIAHWWYNDSSAVSSQPWNWLSP